MARNQRVSGSLVDSKIVPLMRLHWWRQRAALPVPPPLAPKRAARGPHRRSPGRRNLAASARRPAPPRTCLRFRTGPGTRPSKVRVETALGSSPWLTSCRDEPIFELQAHHVSLLRYVANQVDRCLVVYSYSIVYRARSAAAWCIHSTMLHPTAQSGQPRDNVARGCLHDPQPAPCLTVVMQI